MSERKRLLITGAAGLVGSALRKYLRNRYDFRLIFHRNVPETEPEDEVIVSDIGAYEEMVEAADGVDAIVHLGIAAGGRQRSRYNRMVIETDVAGTYNLFEAARINKVPTVIYASSNAITGLHESDGLVSRPDMMPRPRDFTGSARPSAKRSAVTITTCSGCRCTASVSAISPTPTPSTKITNPA